MKRQPTEWVANDVTDKGLISKIAHTAQLKNKTKQITQSKHGQKT